MLLVFSRLDELKLQHKYSNEDIATGIGMSRGGFETMVKKGDMKVSTLIDLSKFFKVPVSYFFEEDKGLSLNEPDIDAVFEVIKKMVKENLYK